VSRLKTLCWGSKTGAPRGQRGRRRTTKRIIKMIKMKMRRRRRRRMKMTTTMSGLRAAKVA